MERAERGRERERVGRSRGAESRAGELGSRLSSVVMCKTKEAYSSFPPIRHQPFPPNIINSQSGGLRCPGPVAGQLCQAAG